MQRGKAARHAAEPRADRFHREAHRKGDGRSDEEHEDAPRDAPRNSSEAQYRDDCDHGEGSGHDGCRSCERDQYLGAAEEVARNLGRLQTEEIADLSARDEHANAVGESDHDGPWNVLHGRSEAGEA